MQRIRKGDEVIVITGRDKGKKGTVTAVHDDGKVVVEGINIVKKHVKPNPMLGQAGGIMDKTLPIEGSNVMLVNPKTGKGDRVGYKVVDGKKVRVFMGVGDAVNDKKLVDHAVEDLTKISGQKPIVTKTRKAIANFKIRENMPIGCMVTLRGERMYEFLDRLVTIAFPRVRDFRGVSARSFDGRGNYNIGLREQIIFPEIEYDKIDKLRGMNISITTTAKTDEEAKALLSAFHFPFRN